MTRKPIVMDVIMQVQKSSRRWSIAKALAIGIGVGCFQVQAQEGAKPTPPRVDGPTPVALDRSNQAVLPASQAGRLRLKNGDYIDGEMTDSNEAGMLGWKNPNLVETMLVPIQSVRSVDTPPTPEQVVSKGRFLIQTHGGDRFWGDLKEWSPERIRIESSVLGEIPLKPGQIRHLRAWGMNPEVLYQGPRTMQEWEVLDNSFKWTIESGALVSNDNGAKVRGSVNLAARVQIDLRISWNRQPNFLFAMGVAPDQTKSGSAFSLEVWEDKLAIVRDIGAKSDAQYLEPLDSKKAFVELTVFLDQTAGRAIVYSDRGKQLADMTLAVDNPKVFPCVLLENYGRELRLDALRVQPWNDQLPSERLATKEKSEKDKAKNDKSDATLSDFLMTKDGKILRGRAMRVDANQIQFREDEGGMQNIPLDQLEELMQSPLALTEDEKAHLIESDPVIVRATARLKDAANEPLADRALVEYEKAWQEWAKIFKQFPDMMEDDRAKPVVEAIEKYREVLKGDVPVTFPLARFWDYRKKLATGKVDAETLQWLSQVRRDAAASGQNSMTAILRDQTRIIGTWKSCQNGMLTIEPDSGMGDIDIAVNRLTAVRGSSSEYALPKQEVNREGVLLIEGMQLSGTFATSPEVDHGTCLAWLPRAGGNAIRLLASAKGRIDFRRADQRTAVAPATSNVQVRVIQNRQTQVNTLPNIKKITSPNITLRSGDLLEAEVTSIDAKGIHFTSKSTTTTFIPHEQVQSVEMRRSLRDRTQAVQKMERLLTVPRTKKNDPPTHLISSIDGDFLRGRVLRMDKKSIVMEVKFQEVQIPAENISQIVWLHDRNWQDEKSKSEADREPEVQSDAGFQVHAVERSGWRLTFAPTRLDEELLHGQSALLGPCSVGLGKIDLLLFGIDIDARARELATNPWLLSLAKLPKVYEEEDGEGDDSSAGTTSSLVGKPAQRIDAEGLDGTPFRLSDLKGKVVVLDFWASWCGPCMKTMPVVDATIRDLNNSDVELVAVNLEEPADRVRAAMERLKLETRVVLDSDGIAAKRYQANAIPETVIIDREGVVRYVFVGGGPKFQEQFRSALEKVLQGSN